MSLFKEIFQKLFDHFGKQNWWPGETPFEVCVGAILTQNTAWSNVEHAIENLKKQNLLNFESLLKASPEIVAQAIRPAGYFNIKTKRLKNFLEGIAKEFGTFDALFHLSKDHLREFLLSLKGIGPETADSMVLYAFEKPVFVVDAYTKRILVRHRLIEEEADYFQTQEFFENALENDPKLFNEYHALIVMTGKNYCKKSKPNCTHCPLKEVNGGPILG